MYCEDSRVTKAQEKDVVVSSTLSFPVSPESWIRANFSHAPLISCELTLFLQIKICADVSFYKRIRV